MGNAEQLCQLDDDGVNRAKNNAQQLLDQQNERTAGAIDEERITVDVRAGTQEDEDVQ